jgi:beta-glucosidase/6-phospho-beta-glucosidase/beta-galactosidase
MPSGKQGWERDDVVDVFTEYAKRLATRWGNKVDWWITVNEPNVQSTVGYVVGIWPPGVSDAERMAEVQRQQVRAHAKAYDAIHLADTMDADGDGKAAMVSMALHQRVYLPKDPTNPDDVAAADHSTYFWNYWYLNALIRGDFDYDFDEKLDGPKDLKASPDFANRFDFVGLNYYGISQVSAKAILLPYMGRQPAQNMLPTQNPKTAMGWDIYPPGFGQVIDQISAFNLPIFITENGVAQETTEATRPRFIAEHLFEVGWAIARGADIRGYTYWALTDNFEWQSGYCPKFGLYTVDYTSAMRTRTPANGRDELGKIATDRKIAQSDIDMLMPYPQAPAKSCKAF